MLYHFPRLILNDTYQQICYLLAWFATFRKSYHFASILLLGIISLIVKPGYIIQGQYTSLVANSSYIIFGKYMTKTFDLVRHSLMFKMILTAGLSLTFVRLIVKKVDFCVQSNFQALKMSTIYTFFEHNCNLLSCF